MQQVAVVSCLAAAAVGVGVASAWSGESGRTLAWSGGTTSSSTPPSTPVFEIRHIRSGRPDSEYAQSVESEILTALRARRDKLLSSQPGDPLQRQPDWERVAEVNVAWLDGAHLGVRLKARGSGKEVVIRILAVPARVSEDEYAASEWGWIRSIHLMELIESGGLDAQLSGLTSAPSSVSLD